jgi:hypothetical protein
MNWFLSDRCSGRVQVLKQMPNRCHRRSGIKCTGLGLSVCLLGFGPPDKEPEKNSMADNGEMLASVCCHLGILGEVASRKCVEG